MMKTIISALAVFIATSIDYLLIITLVFAQARTRKYISHVVGGQYLGTAILIAVSLIAAFILHFIPEEWMIGLLGFVPIILGIRAAVKSGSKNRKSEDDEDDEDDEDNEVTEKVMSRKANRLFWTIALLTIASGGDNLGVYIPYFASMDYKGITASLFVFAVSISVLCYIGYKLSTIHFISRTLEKYERVIVPVVYIALGIYIMVESGTFSKILQVI